MRIITCAECGKEKPHEAKRLCRLCYDRHRYQTHREQELARACHYYQKHQDQRHQYQKQHRKKRLAQNRRWQQENSERVAGNVARRKARRQGVANTLTNEQLDFERKIGEAIYPGEELAMHHIVPISKGGGHTWGNIAFIPSSLNLSIGTKLPEEIYRQGALIH